MSQNLLKHARINLTIPFQEAFVPKRHEGCVFIGRKQVQGKPINYKQEINASR
jgi:hypothetical protein